jgi:hypothetical protein
MEIEMPAVYATETIGKRLKVDLRASEKKGQTGKQHFSMVKKLRVN